MLVRPYFKKLFTLIGDEIVAATGKKLLRNYMVVNNVTTYPPTFKAHIAFQLSENDEEFRYLEVTSTSFEIENPILIIPFDRDGMYIAEVKITATDPKFEELFVIDMMRVNSFSITFNKGLTYE